MKRRTLLAGLGTLVLALADAAHAIPDEAFVADIAVRPDGTTVYLLGLIVDGRSRIGFSTRSDPADPASESPVRLVPLSAAATSNQESGPAALSPDGRFIVGGLSDASMPDEGIRGLIFDTLPAAASPVVISPRQVPFSDETFPRLVGLFAVSSAGLAVGITGIIPPVGPLGTGIRATPDGVARLLEPFPTFGADGDPNSFRVFRPRAVAISGAVVGASSTLFGFLSEPVLLDAQGPLQLARPRTGMSDFVQPEILASDATRERGRIVANAFLETRGAGILVYESPMSTPALYVLGRATLSLRRAALDASSFLGSIGSDLGDPGALFLVRVGGPDAAATCAEGVDAGTFRGLPLRRVEGASVFASGSAGFRFCLAGDRAGEVLIGNDLQRELAAIEDSGFDETSRFAGCVIGDNGTQASILCEGSSRSGEGIQFSDRARLVRNPVQSPFPQLPPCGSGGMQAAFAIPLLAFLGRRSRSRR